MESHSDGRTYRRELVAAAKLQFERLIESPLISSFIPSLYHSSERKSMEFPQQSSYARGHM